jgi:RNA processing factor Prp31
MGEELKAGLEKRIEEIREKYVEPPPIPVRQFKKEKEKWRKSRHAGKR